MIYVYGCSQPRELWFIDVSLSPSKDLVPEKCCHIVAFSQTYKEPFVCNFLGLSSTVEIPKFVTSSDLHVVVDILPAPRGVGGVRTVRLRDGAGGEGEGRGRENGSPLGGYRLVVQSNSKSGDARCELDLYVHMAVVTFVMMGGAQRGTCTCIYIHMYMHIQWNL